MQFNAEQKAALAGPLSASRVKTRTQSGRELSYVEGWWAIAEANRIFGFDGWTRETIDLKCVAEGERKIGRDNAPGWGVTYIARVRVMVGDVIREGCGTGHGIDRDKGLAHESALKEAETDAMKRALMTFGNPFGLALYDKAQNGVEHDTASNGNGSKPSAAASLARNLMSPNEDIKEWVLNFVSTNKNFLSKCETVADVQDWVELRADDLKDLKKQDLPAWNDLRHFKEAKIYELNTADLKETQPV